MLPDATCEHGTAWDVHCCHCHSGFIFDIRHECQEKPMTDVRTDVDDPDVDYVTVLPHVNGREYLVAIYKHVGNGDYLQSKVSNPMNRVAAERVAGAWSAALGLTIRL